MSFNDIDFDNVDFDDFGLKKDYVVVANNKQYMENSRGGLTPLEQIPEADLLRHDTAHDLISKAVVIHNLLREFRRQAEKDIADLVKISAEKYGKKLGGKIGNVTVALYDRTAKIQRVYREQLELTEEIHAAKAMISDCFDRWSEGSQHNMRQAFDLAFKTNKKGDLKTSAVMALFDLNIENDAEWEEAMAALKDSIHVSGQSTYYQVLVRDSPNSKYRSLSLDLAGV